MPVSIFFHKICGAHLINVTAACIERLVIINSVSSVSVGSIENIIVLSKNMFA